MNSRAARSSIRLISICFEIGVEYAYLLSSATMTSGAFWTAAKLVPSWNAPVLVAPSPIQAMATRSRPRMRAPMPMPADSGAMAAGGAMAGAQTIPLQAIGGAPVSGTVAVSESGGGTQVMLAVSGTGAAGTHAAHVHTGTCDAPGDVVAPLESVTADASGAGSSTTTLQLPAATVMNGQHIVAYHAGSGADPGAPVVCGEIPAHSAGDSATQAM